LLIADQIKANLIAQGDVSRTAESGQRTDEEVLGGAAEDKEVAMNWRDVLRWITIPANVLMALWLFASAVTWGPAPIWEGALVALPSTLAVIALAVRQR
jgi:hypothetical protein